MKGSKTRRAEELCHASSSSFKIYKSLVKKTPNNNNNNKAHYS
jgi:hypothetical protein